MSETKLGKNIILMASQIGHRLFRCNHAQGWVGESVRFTKEQMVRVHPGDVLIKRAKPLHAGLCDGQSDYIGWTKNGKFLAVECKTIGKETEKQRLINQKNFIKQVVVAGGVGGIVYTEEDAFELLS